MLVQLLDCLEFIFAGWIVHVVPFKFYVRYRYNTPSLPKVPEKTGWPRFNAEAAPFIQRIQRFPAPFWSLFHAEFQKPVIDKGASYARFRGSILGILDIMPNTKSAERRMRNSARKQLQNHSIKSRLKTLTRTYQDALKAGKKEDATRAYREVTSAFDKAAKSGAIHKANADRKKSRLALQLGKLK
jgi:small subunit ribosomal protein S20